MGEVDYGGFSGISTLDRLQRRRGRTTGSLATSRSPTFGDHGGQSCRILGIIRLIAEAWHDRLGTILQDYVYTCEVAPADEVTTRHVIAGPYIAGLGTANASGNGVVLLAT